MGQTRIMAYVERQASDRAFADAFLPEVLRGVHDAASQARYEVLFAPVPVEVGASRCETLLKGGHVDGIILSGPRTDDLELRRLLETDANVVLQGEWAGVDVASVDVDNRTSARSAVEHLIDLGHTRIGMVVHAPLAYTGAAARLTGYRSAMSTAGLEMSEDWIAIADFSPGSGAQAARELLAANPDLTALFVSSDTVAMGVIRASKELGRSIPDDLSIVGFDDIPMAIYHEPPLSTIHLPAYGIGWAAADLLRRIIDGDEVEEHNVLLDSELIVRGSSGIPPKANG
jgi:DNA-binding LacI/PurR family transcriptional regulator